MKEVVVIMEVRMWRVRLGWWLLVCALLELEGGGFEVTMICRSVDHGDVDMDMDIPVVLAH